MNQARLGDHSRVVSGRWARHHWLVSVWARDILLQLVARQPRALYITSECGRSALSGGHDAPIVNPVAGLRCRVLSTAIIAGDPAPAVFPTMWLRLDPTRKPP
jgi:hypothetical protein